VLFVLVWDTISSVVRRVALILASRQGSAAARGCCRRKVAVKWRQNLALTATRSCVAGGSQPCICDDPARLARITPHRARLLSLIADYQTNEAIARALVIAPATAKREIEDLRDLVGCHSKRELARWWVQHVSVWRELIGEK
jgi:DNA-binding NarL/FixJ family response regulator